MDKNDAPMSDLKPCRECGGKAELVIRWIDVARDGYSVWCPAETCRNVEPGKEYRSRAAAIAAWNRRETPQGGGT